MFMLFLRYGFLQLWERHVLVRCLELVRQVHEKLMFLVLGLLNEEASV
uniref:Uncharacterized protein n=1 Tax=Arundo donax TaxID=35708 RepID=A0A0A9CI72_ARUDO